MNKSKRILIVDDQKDIREYLSKILLRLGNSKGDPSLLKKTFSGLFQQTLKKPTKDDSYFIDTAENGRSAYEIVKKATEENNPYSVMFLDMRMPGWDGLETMEKIWELDPQIQVVLCSAYTDYSWEDIVNRVGERDNLLILKKPFDVVEVLQLALALNEKYFLRNQSLRRMRKLEKTEEELRYTKNCLKNVFQSLPSVLISIDSDGVIIQWNLAAEEYTGIPASKAINQKIWTTVPFLNNYQSNFEKVVKYQRAEELQRINLMDNGDEKYLNISMSPLTDDNTETVDLKGVVIRIDDVTETVKKDEHLRQAQKMETVGNLAAGLAHDFKNILGGIKGTLSSIKYSLDRNKGNSQGLTECLDDDLEIIKESVQQGTDLVKQLLLLSSNQELPFSPTDLTHSINNVIKICENTLDKCIEIKIENDFRKAMINAFPTQIDQVLLNLCVNASHAMTIMREETEEEGGTLTVALNKISVGKNISSTVPDAEEGDFWLLSVSDTGVGMKKEVISKIFDPFFSTKAKNEGTGLGLSMVYNIIRQHNGFIEVYSEPGNGTTFFIFLPLI